MNEIDRCDICNNLINKQMVICPSCGSVISKKNVTSKQHNHYDYNMDKNLEYLEKMDIALCHLEEELDAFLCKKR